MFFINAGLTRSATSKLHTLISNSGVIGVPSEKKELNFFLKKSSGVSPSVYLSNFDSGFSDFFESSPAYCHVGIERYVEILKSINSTLGDEVCYVFLLRNLLDRAFSHYWYMISHHHAMYGAVWKIKKKDHPDRYKKIFNDSFYQFIEKNAPDFLFPEIDKIIAETIDLVGKNNVIVSMSDDVGDVAREIFARVMPKDESFYCSYFFKSQSYVKDKVNVSTVPLIKMNKLNQSVEVNIESKCCELQPGDMLISDARGCDILKAEIWGEDKLEEILLSKDAWTQEMDVKKIPSWVLDRILEIRNGLHEIPESCFVDKIKVVKNI